MMNPSEDAREELNPLVLIITMIVVTIGISLDKRPFYTLAMIVWAIALSQIVTSYSPVRFLWKLRYPFLIGFLYSVFIIIGKKLGNHSLDMEFTIALGLRFIAIAAYSFVFIETINPKLLVMSFIKYFKMTDAMGFAFLSAYRFFPTFRHELQQIKFSHAVRGIGAKGITAPIVNLKNYTIPILVSAIRRGIRISIAMENRAFGKYETRVYYDELTMTKRDKRLLVTNLLVLLGCFVLFYFFNLIQFRGGH